MKFKKKTLFCHFDQNKSVAFSLMFSIGVSVFWIVFLNGFVRYLKDDRFLLTHYHTIPHFDLLMIYSCGKQCEKRRTCLEQAISPFLTMFSTLCGTLKCRLQFVSIWTSLKLCCLVMG